MNVVVLIGRMVADAELKYTPSGLAVATFSIAVNRRFKSDSGEKTADFFNVVAWKQSAEYISNYGGKGKQVAVNGRLQQRTWVQQDGQKRSVVEVVAENMQLLDSKPREGQAGQPSTNDYTPVDNMGSSSQSESEMDYDPFAEE